LLPDLIIVNEVKEMSKYERSKEKIMTAEPRLKSSCTIKQKERLTECQPKHQSFLFREKPPEEKCKRNFANEQTQKDIK
jgi:hypothetical protein